MNVATGNLFANLSQPPTPVEQFDTLLARRDLKIERIVSHGQTTPDGEWFDQDTDEWVVLLSGASRLRIEGRAEVLEMRPGDWVFLPAHVRHRVDWTDPNTASVWLAIHIIPVGA